MQSTKSALANAIAAVAMAISLATVCTIDVSAAAPAKVLHLVCDGTRQVLSRRADGSSDVGEKVPMLSSFDIGRDKLITADKVKDSEIDWSGPISTGLLTHPILGTFHASWNRHSGKFTATRQFGETTIVEEGHCEHSFRPNRAPVP